MFKKRKHLMEKLLNLLAGEWAGAPIGIWLSGMVLILLLALILVVSRVPLRISRKTKDGSKVAEFEIATMPTAEGKSAHANQYEVSRLDGRVPPAPS